MILETECRNCGARLGHHEDVFCAKCSKMLRDRLQAWMDKLLSREEVKK